MDDEVATKKKHGGARPGAGRKKSVRRGGPHRARPELSKTHPVHVTLRLNRFELRNRTVYNVIRRVLAVLLDAPDFRVVHISIQNNHLHLLVEADNRRALTRGMQRFSIRTARALGIALGHGGKIFPWRYHAKQITTPRQARNALAYVLNNWRRHREDQGHPIRMAAKLDPYSRRVVCTSSLVESALAAGTATANLRKRPRANGM
jgi:REP element-mobilizing transposase RayT